MFICGAFFAKHAKNASMTRFLLVATLIFKVFFENGLAQEKKARRV